MTLWLWLAFALVVGTLIVVDLGLVTRRPRAVSTPEALASFLLWVAAAVGFSLLVWQVYQSNWLNLEAALAEALPGTHPRQPDLDGHTAWAQWATAYVLEVALSLDNIAIAALLLTHFRIPRTLAGRTLFWSILVSLVVRLLLILAGAWALRSIDWVKWAFGGLLVLALLRTLIGPDEHTDFSSKWPVRVIRRLLPVSPDHDGQRLFTRHQGKLAITPMMLVVLVSVGADLSFAIDSVPAMFAVTRDPFIAFSASALAILGLRSLYFALAGVLRRFRYLRLSLVFILLATAGKMFLVNSDSIYFERHPTLIMLAIVAAIVGLAVMASALRRSPLAATPGAEAAEPVRPTPLEDLTEAVDSSRRNFRKVVILIVGSAVALLGIIIVGPLPGPGGIPVILLGLTILATEFIWARRLLHKMKEQSRAVAEKADRVAAKSSPWLVPPVLLGVIAAIMLVAHFGPFKPLMIYLIGTGPLIAVGYWGWRTIAAWRRARKAPRIAADRAPSPRAQPTRRSPAA